jgi:hypothetical protein
MNALSADSDSRLQAGSNVWLAAAFASCQDLGPVRRASACSHGAVLRVEGAIRGYGGKTASSPALVSDEAPLLPLLPLLLVSDEEVDVVIWSSL